MQYVKEKGNKYIRVHLFGRITQFRFGWLCENWGGNKHYVIDLGFFELEITKGQLAYWNEYTEEGE